MRAYSKLLQFGTCLLTKKWDIKVAFVSVASKFLTGFIYAIYNSSTFLVVKGLLLWMLWVGAM
jgi:hypothetical protein